MVGSAGTEPELRFGPGIQGRSPAGSPQHGEPFGVSQVRSSCRQKPDKPEQRGASHDGRSAKTNCDAALDESSGLQSRWPERLVVLSRRKLRDRRASLETTELRSESFSECLWPYLKPERVRDNKERRLGGRPVESRQQASPSSTRRTASQDKVRRKASGNGRGREE
jgi:hypothetical protein